MISEVITRLRDLEKHEALKTREAPALMSSVACTNYMNITIRVTMSYLLMIAP